MRNSCEVYFSDLEMDNSSKRILSTGNKRKRQTKNLRKCTWRWFKVNIGNASEVSASMIVTRRVKMATTAGLVAL